MSFRKSVTGKAHKVWANNRQKDLYTGWHRNKFDKEDIDTEVDHIIECQLGEDIWERALDGRRTTRGRLGPVVELWNNVDNLNVTNWRLNRSKGAALKAWKKGTEPTLRDAMISYNVASNQRTKIVCAFEEAVGWMCDCLGDLADETNCDLYNDMACELDHWNEKTG